MLKIIKIGGNVINDSAILDDFLKQFAALDGLKIIVHGGGKLATEMAEKLNISQQLVEGRRITDAASLEVVVMVYAGLINKNIVATLGALNCPSLGLCGADNQVILSHKRKLGTVDFGFVGDVDCVQATFIQTLLNQGLTPVFSAITSDKNGQLLNTNADTIAAELAIALAALMPVELLFTFEKSGVLLDVENEASCLRKLDMDTYEKLKSEGKIFAGMLPKLDNAFRSLERGLKAVRIGSTTDLKALFEGKIGTELVTTIEPATLEKNTKNTAAYFPENSMRQEAVSLLNALIACPSFSREEEETAAILMRFFKEKKISSKRHLNNVWAKNKHFSIEKPTVLLNSHHDTVKPNQGYSRNPFEAIEEDGKLFGLGSNDAGGALVSLAAVFCHFYAVENLPFNLFFAASAEEEISGKNGIESLLKVLPKIDFGIVGEPTLMQMAVAEKGLMVLDCTAAGKAGHAARSEGENALYNALEAIFWFKNHAFEAVSPFLGPVKMSVTQIQAGSQHNVVPDTCTFVVDVRVNECYTFEEVLAEIRANVKVDVEPRSTRLRSTKIEENHPLVQAGKSLGLSSYGSPTLSDKALMPFPTLKIGPGDSARSHTADEFIFLEEIEQGIEVFKRLIESLIFNLD